ncbi:unnamed protein product [Staurois parvus]|uniref:Uncharacterized protein n=1 Tax=Staurois parvus TaxID=386267 RepID=A0ABN9EJH5_9NEOB|nr:unnamed protein product [Staurois parvus]
MYIHTQTHVHTDTNIHTYTHTRRHMYIHADTCTGTHMNIHTYTCTIVYAYTGTQTHTHTHTHVHPPSPIKSRSTSLFTHRSGYCTLGGGREHSTHSLVCFHCAQLLSSLMAPSANDRSGLRSEPAQQDSPGGHTSPHQNFHSPLASRNFKP